MHWGYKDEASIAKRFFWTSEQMVMLEVLQDRWGAQSANRREGTGPVGACVHPTEGAAGARGLRVSSEVSPELHLQLLWRSPRAESKVCAGVLVGPQEKQRIQHNTLNNVTWSPSCYD